jgi:hypothetical protein
MHFGEVHSLQSKKFSIVFINLSGTGNWLLVSSYTHENRKTSAFLKEHKYKFWKLEWNF